MKEAWSEAAGRRTGDRIRGGAEQGERAVDREAVVTKARRRRSGGRAAKVDVLTRGDLALRLKGRRRSRGLWSEKSAEAIVVARAAKGRTMGRVKCSRFSMMGCHRSRAQTSSAPPIRAVKPRRLPGVWEVIDEKRKHAPRHLPQPVEPPGADPHAGWCGRGGVERLPPIPIVARPNRAPQIQQSSGLLGGLRAAFMIYFPHITKI